MVKSRGNMASLYEADNNSDNEDTDGSDISSQDEQDVEDSVKEDDEEEDEGGEESDESEDSDDSENENAFETMERFKDDLFTEEGPEQTSKLLPYTYHDTD